MVPYLAVCAQLLVALVVSVNLITASTAEQTKHVQLDPECKGFTRCENKSEVVRTVRGATGGKDIEIAGVGDARMLEQSIEAYKLANVSSKRTNLIMDILTNKSTLNETLADLLMYNQYNNDTSQQQDSDAIPPYMQRTTTILVILHVSVFITGLVGNSLVCLSVYRNKSLQTVTNYYIVNLAVADFLVILICLPPTVYWDIYLYWNFGLVLCKLVLYLQVSL